jgi:hypothetical protein
MGYPQRRHWGSRRNRLANVASPSRRCSHRGFAVPAMGQVRRGRRNHEATRGPERRKLASIATTLEAHERTLRQAQRDGRAVHGTQIPPPTTPPGQQAESANVASPSRRCGHRGFAVPAMRQVRRGRRNHGTLEPPNQCRGFAVSAMWSGGMAEIPPQSRGQSRTWPASTRSRRRSS